MLFPCCSNNDPRNESATEEVLVDARTAPAELARGKVRSERIWRRLGREEVGRHKCRDWGMNAGYPKCV